MPTPINGFQCNKCMHVHAKIENAEACEAKHGNGFEYEPVFEKGKLGPSEIKCTFTKDSGEKYTKHYY